MKRSLVSLAVVISSVPPRLDALTDCIAAIGWTVQAFGSVRDAVAELPKAPPDVVFCDAGVRGATPAGLYAWLQRNAPATKMYVIADDTLPVRATHAGIPILTLPLDEDLLPRPADAPDTKPQGSEPDHGVPLRGDTRTTSLAALLELMGAARTSGWLELGEGGARGALLVQDGRLVHAEAAAYGVRPRAAGLAALAELLDLEGLPFRLHPPRGVPRATLNLPVSVALPEAAKLADENRRYLAIVTALRSACPRATDLAVGYAKSAGPRAGHGDAQELFSVAQRLLSESREAIGGSTTDLLLASPATALAALRFGDDSLLAVRSVPGDRARLLALMHKAVRDATEEPAAA